MIISDVLRYFLLTITSIIVETQIGVEVTDSGNNSTSIWAHQTNFDNYLKPLRLKRRSRTTQMEKTEKLETIRLHNMYRGKVSPIAADMEYMEWDDRLATLAQTWADNCQWKHGHPPHDFKKDVGQNLYRGSSKYIAKAMSLWYDEYKDYDYHTITCKPNAQCGHYTQIVWSTSLFVGCGISENCWSDFKYYIVCNYWPAGNYRGEFPYIEGKPCTRCNSTSGLCTNNKCVSRSKCEEKKLNCACDLKCYNCGELDHNSCKCKCKDGWTSLDCTKQCADTKECRRIDCLYYEGSRKHPCPKTCGLCKGVNKSDLQNTCCDGVLCPAGFAYHTSDTKYLQRPCDCRPLCHGPKCDGIVYGPHFIIIIAVSIFCTIWMDSYEP